MQIGTPSGEVSLLTPDKLTRQYSSMGFSLFTATSRMWLLRKRILPGRQSLMSWVIKAKASLFLLLGLSILAGHWPLPPLSTVKEPKPKTQRRTVTSTGGQEAPKSEGPRPLSGCCHLGRL